MDISDLKSAARVAAYDARKIAHGQKLDLDANMQLLSFIKAQDKSAIISAYMPIRTEVSPLPAMEAAHMRGYQICVPVVMGKSMPLEFHHWTPDTEMIEGAFGAMIPKDGQILEPDVIITPLLAFDMAGYRLGYGGGFYDRSFEQLSEKKKITAVGYAYSDQELMIVPREETDYRLDKIITEKGLLSFDN